MESMMSGLSSDWIHSSSADLSFNSVMEHRDNCVIRHHEDETKMEVQLDTVGYKPDESGQFARQYALPQGAKPEEVVSSLSKDGVLAIQVPKHPPKKLSATRAVPIALK